MTTETSNKLTRGDVADLVSQRHPEFVKKQVRVIVNSTLDALAEAIATGKLVEIRRLGVFSTKRLPARKSRNPKTGAEIFVPRYRGVSYRMSQEIKVKLAKLLEDTSE